MNNKNLISGNNSVAVKSCGIAKQFAAEKCEERRKKQDKTDNFSAILFSSLW